MKYRAPAPVELPAWRRIVLLVFLVLFFMALIGRSFYLQISQADFLQAKSASRVERDIVLPSFRGKILDRNGLLLAMSSPVETVSADPTKVEITKEQLAKLSALLNVKQSEISKKLAKKNSVHEYLKRRMDPKVAKEAMKLGIKGLYLQREYKRFYPKAEEIAHVVGLQGRGEDKEKPTEGYVGLELQFDAELKGKHGNRQIVRDPKGRVMEDLKAIVRPQDGNDVVLSIDQSIQYYAYRELLKGVSQAKAKAGSAVVLDAKTGEVLAMARVPSFNPNNLSGYKGGFKNTAVSDVFEPGSTMKPFAVAAGLESGYYTPNTMIDTEKGYLDFKGFRIHDTKPHGVISVSDVIKMSSNVGTSKIAQTLGKEALWKSYKKMAFGQKTDIEFPGEAAGVVRHYSTLSNAGLATISYGNGISVTLLQIARAYTVFANDGVLMPVTLKKREKMPVGTRVFSAKTANQVKAMLETVVSEDGTAPQARVAGYSVAGKTGTSRKTGKHGYEQGKYMSSFVGLAPASNPKLIVAVLIDEPSTIGNRYYGGWVAAPVFSAVMGESLDSLGIPKDMPTHNVVMEQVVSEQKVGVSRAH